MADLILKTRFDVLRSNLRRVTEVGSTEGGSVENLRTELKRLLNLPRDVELISPLDKISDLVISGRKAIRRRDADEALDCLKEIGQLVDAIQDHLEQAEEAADNIMSRAMPIRGEGSPEPALQDGLVEKAAAQIKALDRIESDLLMRAAAVSRHGEPETARKLQKEAWEEYSRTVFRESNAVFCEYLDFLSGLALRDTGLDQGMCRIADRLLRNGANLPDDFTWNSLTIPAQREALQATLAKIVRLGFPEWTIWALPLAGHEFGHVAVTIKKIESFVSQRARTEPERHRLQVCLADAFATHMMGPAYACAVILLRLDPTTAFAQGDDRLTEKRARVVLAMLNHMDAQAEPTEQGSYGAIHDKLQSEWNEALRQVDGNDTLSPQEEADIKDWVDLISNTMGFFRMMPASKWPRVEELAASLEPGKVDHVRLKGDSPRIVLNAAWKRRIEENDFTQLDRVAEAAVRLLNRIEAESHPQPDAGPWRPSAETFGSYPTPVSNPAVADLPDRAW